MWQTIGAFPLQGGTRTFRNQNLFFWFWFCFHCERPGSRRGSWNLLEPFFGPAPEVELNLSSGNLWAGLAALLLLIGWAEPLERRLHNTEENWEKSQISHNTTPSFLKSYSESDRQKHTNSMDATPVYTSTFIRTTRKAARRRAQDMPVSLCHYTVCVRERRCLHCIALH